LLGPDDDRVPGGHPVVVLSDAFWHRSFGGDAGVLGTTLDINRSPLTVVGVTLPQFFGTQVGENPDIYLPMMMDEIATRGRTERLERRLSLGAGRRRRMRQLVTGSVLLSGFGGVLGVGIAFVPNRALLSILQTGRAPLAVSS
jgi:hypothetical protein